MAEAGRKGKGEESKAKEWVRDTNEGSRRGLRGGEASRGKKRKCIKDIVLPLWGAKYLGETRPRQFITTLIQQPLEQIHPNCNS